MSTQFGRNPYTKQEEEALVAFIAENNPDGKGRRGNQLYKLLEDKNKYPWVVTHPWSSWRDKYVKNSDDFDERIRRYQKLHNIRQPDAPYSPPKPKDATTPKFSEKGKQRADNERNDGRGADERKAYSNADAGPSTSPKKTRNVFSEEDNRNLVAYLARRQELPRAARALYQPLEDHEKYPWANNHPYQSWLRRYTGNREWYDKEITAYQKKHKIKPIKADRLLSTAKDSGGTKRKRARESSMESEVEQKRTKLGKDKDTLPKKAASDQKSRANTSKKSNGKAPPEIHVPPSDDYEGDPFASSSETEDSGTDEPVDTNGKEPVIKEEEDNESDLEIDELSSAAEEDQLQDDSDGGQRDVTPNRPSLFTPPRDESPTEQFPRSPADSVPANFAAFSLPPSSPPLVSPLSQPSTTKRKPKKTEEDWFASSSDEESINKTPLPKRRSPTVISATKKPRSPPKLVDGPYRTSFKVVEKEKVLETNHNALPSRDKAKSTGPVVTRTLTRPTKNGEQDQERTVMKAPPPPRFVTHEKSSPTLDKPGSVPVPAAAKARPSQRQENAVASSSRVKLPINQSAFSTHAFDEAPITAVKGAAKPGSQVLSRKPTVERLEYPRKDTDTPGRRSKRQKTVGNEDLDRPTEKVDVIATFAGKKSHSDPMVLDGDLDRLAGPIRPPSLRPTPVVASLQQTKKLSIGASAEDHHDSSSTRTKNLSSSPGIYLFPPTLSPPSLPMVPRKASDTSAPSRSSTVIRRHTMGMGSPIPQIDLYALRAAQEDHHRRNLSVATPTATTGTPSLAEPVRSRSSLPSLQALRMQHQQNEQQQQWEGLHRRTTSLLSRSVSAYDLRGAAASDSGVPTTRSVSLASSSGTRTRARSVSSSVTTHSDDDDDNGGEGRLKRDVPFVNNSQEQPELGARLDELVMDWKCAVGNVYRYTRDLKQTETIMKVLKRDAEKTGRKLIKAILAEKEETGKEGRIGNGSGEGKGKGKRREADKAVARVDSKIRSETRFDSTERGSNGHRVFLPHDEVAYPHPKGLTPRPIPPTSSPPKLPEAIYTPPHTTRAGKFARLSGRGQLEEAVRREVENAGTTPTKSSQKLTLLPSGPRHPPAGEPQENESRAQSNLEEGALSPLKMERDVVEESDTPMTVDEDRVNNEFTPLSNEDGERFLDAGYRSLGEMEAVERQLDPDALLLWVAEELGCMANPDIS